MPVHDWQRVSAGMFHHFHCSWITHLGESLNDGRLPEGYYAMTEQHAGQTLPDILTLQASCNSSFKDDPGAVAVKLKPPPERQYDVSADGRFLVNRIDAAELETPLTIALNWHSALRR